MKQVKEMEKRVVSKLFKDKLKIAIGDCPVAKFAKKCKLSEGVLRLYLKGETYPSLDRLDAISLASNRDPQWFISTTKEDKNFCIEKKDFSQREDLSTRKDQTSKDKWDSLFYSLNEEEAVKILEITKKRGTQSLLIEEDTRKIALSIDELPQAIQDETRLEIFAIVQEAQIQALKAKTGKSYASENCEVENKQRRAG